MSSLSSLSPSDAVELFEGVKERDSSFLQGRDWLTDWLFVRRQLARGKNTDKNFLGFDGPSHLTTFFRYLKGPSFPDYLPEAVMAPLVDASALRDEDVLSRLGLQCESDLIRKVARYNAQDYVLRQPYAVPARQQARVRLDFGAGHGRQANLIFAPVDNHQRDELQLIAIDGVVSSYLTQALYFQALGLGVGEYVLSSPSITFEELRIGGPVTHLPTWRFDLVPSKSVDEITAVQVLREIPRRLLLWVLQEFARVLKPGGALYVRDSPLQHSPNMLPQEALIGMAGFTLEWRPHVREGVDLHGVPSIWRRQDDSAFESPVS